MSFANRAGVPMADYHRPLETGGQGQPIGQTLYDAGRRSWLPPVPGFL